MEKVRILDPMTNHILFYYWFFNQKDVFKKLNENNDFFDSLNLLNSIGIITDIKRTLEDTSNIIQLNIDGNPYQIIIKMDVHFSSIHLLLSKIIFIRKKTGLSDGDALWRELYSILTKHQWSSPTQ